MKRAAPANTIALVRLGLLSSRVPRIVFCRSSTVVELVARLIPTSVVCSGRILVSISLAAGDEANFAVPASALTEPESLTSGVPSARQKTSVSSFSIRLHAGQRFIFGVLRLVAAFSFTRFFSLLQQIFLRLNQSGDGSPHSKLLRQADAPQQVSEARVAPQAVPILIYFEIYNVMVSFLKGLFQPC